MKKEISLSGRRHGLRARPALLDRREEKTILTFEKRAQVYCWSTDRRGRPVLKH